MAAVIDFTIRSIEALRPPETGRTDYRDAKTPGLQLRVTSTGIKTFSFVGRPRGGGKPERLTFGRFPAVKPEEARAKAREVSGRLASGVSIADAQRERRQELTVADLYETVYRPYLQQRGRKVEDCLWERHVKPLVGSRRLSELTAHEVDKMRDAIPARVIAHKLESFRALEEKRRLRFEEVSARRTIRRHGPPPRPYVPRQAPEVPPETGWRTANMAVAMLSAMFNVAADPRRKLFSGNNPTKGCEHFPERERERFLLPSELGPFFQALADEPNTRVRDFFLIALLTGARRGNVLSMQWKDVDLTDAAWRIPGQVMKNGQPHIVPLGPEAVQILSLRAEANPPGSAYVFPSERSASGHMVSPTKAWKQLLARAGLKDLRPHDLRRTLGSWQARTGSSLILIGKSLAHKTQEATAIYARLDLDPVRQSMDRAASAMFEAAGIKQGAKVLALRGKAATELPGAEPGQQHAG